MALKSIGAKGIIFVASTVTATKLEALKSYGVEVRHHGDDCMDAEIEARRAAQVRVMLVQPDTRQDIEHSFTICSELLESHFYFLSGEKFSSEKILKISV